MIKRTAILAFAVIAILVMGRTSAVAANAPVKIGVIQIQQVFENCRFATQQRKLITQSFKTQEDEIRMLRSQIEADSKALQSDAMLDRNSPEYRERVLRIQILEVRLQGRIKRFDNLRRSKMNEYWVSLYRDFRTAVTAIAKQYQYDLIMTAPTVELSEELIKQGSPEAVMNKILLSNVQHISAEVDITSLVTRTMDQIYKNRTGN